MVFIDLSKPNMTHLYYAYVFEENDDDDKKAVSMLYRLGAIMDFKRKMRDQQRKFDVVKVW